MRVVSFNVYWLQGSSFAAFPPPPGPREEVADGVAALLAELAADLLCIQELQAYAVAADLADRCRMAWWLYRTGRLSQRPQYGGASLAREAGFSFSAVDDDRLERFAIKAVRPGDGLCVANVHLRSNRFADSVAEASRRRCEELAAVLEGEPGPHVVAGDFNAAPGEPAWNLLRAAGYFDAADRAGLGDAATTIGTGRGDRIWVAGQLADRFGGAGVVPKQHAQMPDGEPLSDHLPLWADLDV